ncbi:MAG TPA: FtsX-like permease family protein [Candidatus Anoxymicrobiaceae bacterium]
MSLLNRKLLRDMRSHKSQVVAVLVIVMLGTAILTTMLIVPRALDGWVNYIFGRTSYEDFKVEARGVPPEAIAPLGSERNIKAVQATIEEETSASIKGKELTLLVVSLPDQGRPAVNSVMVESGTYPPGGAAGGFLAERHLAQQFGLKPGDSVKLIVNGRDVALTMSGSGSSPRFLRLVSGQNTMLSDPAQFGVIFIRQADARRIFGTDQYDVVAFRVRDAGPAALTRTMRAMAERLAPFGVVGTNTGADEQSTRLIEMDLKNMKNVAVFFTLIFLWVASLAIYITLARIIYTEQRQIGTARALGYEKRTLVRHFLLYGVFFGVTGGLLGVAGGVVLGRLTVTAYAGTLGLPPIGVNTQPWAIVTIGFAVAILLAVLGAVLPARNSAGVVPAAAMRVDAGVTLRELTHADKRRAERRKFFPPWLRFPLRNLSRNRKRTVLTALGLVLTVSTLVTVSGAITSIQHILDKQFQQVVTWDVAAYLPNPVGPSFLTQVRGMGGVSRAEPAIDAPARLRASGRSIDVDVQAYTQDTQMHGLFPAGGRQGPPTQGGMLVNRSLRRQVPLKVGQRVTVETAVGPAELVLEGFVKEPMGVGCYVDLGYIQRLTGSDRYNLVLIKTAPGKDTAVAEALRHSPVVYKVETKSSTMAAIDSTINKAIRPMFNVVLVMVMGIGIAIIFTMVSITMLERRQEIATMLTLGSRPWAVGRSFLIETTAIALGILPAGIVLGWAFCWVLINKVLSASTTQLAPELSLSPTPLVLIAVSFVVLMALAVLPSIRQLAKIDLATAARERTG